MQVEGSPTSRGPSGALSPLSKPHLCTLAKACRSTDPGQADTSPTGSEGHTCSVPGDPGSQPTRPEAAATTPHCTGVPASSLACRMQGPEHTSGAGT
ncbi:hypothetical protein NDU88_001565 [Pleurodeles waltl]|uniref:Uncharacterized protein n=1 Tax=Pleurodeles waltl TaxID=8319 RepID=A0AAV7P752_PLEWA|nr:hypothetical protein NDU88_001565 [Pleurodeles waltl]